MFEKSAARQFLVSVSGIEGHWARKTGGHPMSTATKVWDGGAVDPDILTSPKDHEDLTVSRPYSVSRDAPIAKRLRAKVGRTIHTITVQPTDPDLVRAGEPTQYFGVLLRVNEPDVDSGSSDAANIELVFAIHRIG